MSLNPTLRRRWIGGVSLGGALLLLVAGETILKGRLSPLAVFALYFICLLLTVVAITIAFVDARALARSTLKEQRELFESTLKRIEHEAATEINRKKANGDSHPSKRS